MLTDADAIDHVYNGEHGLLAGDVTDKLFIEMSTVRPEIEIALAKVVRASGARFVECPVGGTTGPARQGKLFGFMGAEPGDAELAKPILDQLCRRLEHVGPVGNGALAKFTINMPLMIYYQALGEALAMARPIGLEPERLMDMIADTSGGPTMMKTRAPTVAKMMQRRGHAGDVRSRRLHQGSAIDAGRRQGARALAAAGADDARLHGGVGVEGSRRQGSRDAFGLLGEEIRGTRLSCPSRLRRPRPSSMSR